MKLESTTQSDACVRSSTALMDELIQRIDQRPSETAQGEHLQLDHEVAAVLFAVAAELPDSRNKQDLHGAVQLALPGALRPDDHREEDGARGAKQPSGTGGDDGADDALLDEEPDGSEHVDHHFWAVAESGVLAHHGGGSGWEVMSHAAVENSWLQAVHEIFEYFMERTPGSFVERGDRTIRWSYGGSAPELGSQQASNLVEHLEKVLHNEPAETLWEVKIARAPARFQAGWNLSLRSCVAGHLRRGASAWDLARPRSAEDLGS